MTPRRLFLITLLVLSSSPAYAEWVEIGGNDQIGMTTYADPGTIRRNGDLVKMWRLNDFKTVQTVEDNSFLSTKKRGRNNGKNFYMCIYHHNRGPEVCTNGQRITQHALDAAVIQAFHAVLDKRMLTEAVERALATIRANQTTVPDQRRAIERHLTEIEARLRHLVESIATGKATEAVYSELQKAEAEKTTLTAKLSGLNRLTSLAAPDSTRITRALAERVADVKGLLGQHIPQTRQLLRKLIEDESIDGKRRPGRIVCTPFHDARGTGYELTRGVPMPAC
jgi:hypothetical protein